LAIRSQIMKRKCEHWDRRISLLSSLSKRLHGTTIIAIPWLSCWTWTWHSSRYEYYYDYYYITVLLNSPSIG